MITELCIDVINSFQELRCSLEAVRTAIVVNDQHLPAWFQEPAAMHLPAQNSSREKACALLCQLEYLNDQEPREILVGAGIFAASSTTLAALQTLNNAKNNFKRAILKLKSEKISNSNEYLLQTFEQLLPQRDINLANNLTRMGMARLHLKQCYRRVPIFYERPNKIAWTWANTRSIKKITVQEADIMLRKQNIDAGIERQIKLLEGLSANEPLAIIQELAPHLRANIVFADASGSRRLMVKGPVPIFYLANENLPLPELTAPGQKKGKNKDRNIRKDVKINPEPFLPAIRAHRYYRATTTTCTS